MQNMVIWLEESLQSGSWCQAGNDGFGEATRFETPADIAELIAQARHSVVLLPSQFVGFTNASIPAKQPRQIIKALPFVVEEQLASDVAENHFALIGRQKNQAFACYADAGLLQNIQKSFAVEAIVPDAMALAIAPGEWSVLLQDNYALVRTGPFEGFRCHADNLMLMLDHVSHPEQQPVQIYCADPAQVSMLVAQIENHGFAPHVTQTDNPWSLLQRPYNQWLSANLLVDDLKTEKAKGNNIPPIFKTVAGMAAAAMLIFFVSNVWQGLQYRQMTNEVHAASEAYFRQLFPGERITSMERQLRAKLAANTGSGGQGNFIELLGLTGATLQANPALSGMQLTSVRFTEKNGSLELELSAQSIAQVDELKQALLQQGLQVDIDSATSDKDVVKALLKVSRHA